ncbi:MAG: ThuA domain-containing protein [Bacteroidota bacterium]
MKNLSLTFLFLCAFQANSFAQIRVMNFQGDNGFQHDSKDEARAMIELLAEKNTWILSHVDNSNRQDFKDLEQFDVLVFNNNCGTDGPVFSKKEQEELKKYIRNGGGFVGIHCAGAMWKEEGEEFQSWYEKLIGTRLVAHPKVQWAKLVVENESHLFTKHLPQEWHVEDEWHCFSSNPRGQVNVLMTLDENSYEAESRYKMGADHPFSWYQYYEGSRSFFTSLGHTEGVYKDADYQKMIEQAILWAAGSRRELSWKSNSLILDLDANKEVLSRENGRVYSWTNQVKDFAAQDFVSNDYGVRLSKPGSGMPELKREVAEINGNNAIAFEEDELVNLQEDAFDYLITGSGYTWFAVLKPYPTQNSAEETEFGLHRLKDVNSFMGNLRNSGNYEGFWGCLEDDLTFWCGSRSGISFGRFDENNPKLRGPKLEADKFYILAARMGAGTDTVDIELFVNDLEAYASLKYPVNVYANPSKLAIGTERDATNHPGSESFDGEIARILIYERPLTEEEFKITLQYLANTYKLKIE